MKYLETEKPPFRRKSTQMKGDMKKINFPAAPDNHSRILEITLGGLKAGDEITFESLYGLLVGMIPSP